MKILNNYAVSNYNFNYKSQRVQKFPNFEGYRVPKNLAYDDIVTIAGNSFNRLHLTSEKVLEKCGNFDVAKMDFFRFLSKEYYKKNYYLANGQKENPENVLNLLNLVKVPTKSHYIFIEHSNFSFKNLYELVKLTKNNPKLLVLLNCVHKDISQGNIDNDVETEFNILRDLLSSKNVQEYAENYKTYRPYVVINSKDKNLVNKLDSMVESGSYSKEYYKREAFVKQFNFINLDKFNDKFLANNYSDVKISFFESFIDNMRNYLRQEKFMDKQDELIDIYMSTNSNNAKFRKYFVEAQKEQLINNMGDKKKNVLANMKRIFDIAEKDKDAKSFIKKSIESQLDIPFERYIELLENLDTKKLNIFFDNFVNVYIQNRNNPNLIKKVNTNIENPNYVSYQLRRLYLEDLRDEIADDEYNNVFDIPIVRFSKSIVNKFNQLRYKISLLFSDKQGSITEVSKPVVNSQKVDIVNSTPMAKEASEEVVKEVAKEPISQEPKLESQPIIIATPVKKAERKTWKKYAEEHNLQYKKPEVSGVVLNDKLAQEQISKAKKPVVIEDVKPIEVPETKSIEPKVIPVEEKQVVEDKDITSEIIKPVVQEKTSNNVEMKKSSTIKSYIRNGLLSVALILSAVLGIKKCSGSENTSNNNTPQTTIVTDSIKAQETPAEAISINDVEAVKQSHYVKHTVKKGESFWKITENYLRQELGRELTKADMKVVRERVIENVEHNGYQFDSTHTKVLVKPGAELEILVK